MILYDQETCGVLFVVRCSGSVFPKAFAWAFPNAVLAVLLHSFHEELGSDFWDVEGAHLLWAGYTSVLGFLMVFRNNQAYTRFWEGATLINQVRGEWFNAVSTLFTFCSPAPEVQDQVKAFQKTLLHLMSLLHSSALQQVCDLKDDRLEIVACEGMDEESHQFLMSSNDRCEILMQWIQRLIVECDEGKIIKVAPPLLTRVFQELSRGMVHLNNARKIKEIPFPFPYSQMLTVMLLVHWLSQPMLASQVIKSRIAAAVVCFFVTFAFWSLIYIAREIDQPFGEDANDLPLRDMQKDFNRSCLNLLHPLAQKVPNYRSLTPHLRITMSKPDLMMSRTRTTQHMKNWLESAASSTPEYRHTVPAFCRSPTSLAFYKEEQEEKGSPTGEPPESYRGSFFSSDWEVEEAARRRSHSAGATFGPTFVVDSDEARRSSCAYPSREGTNRRSSLGSEGSRRPRRASAPERGYHCRFNGGYPSEYLCSASL